jgi:NitT/TauT family transport system substrate-binding protein
MPARRSAAILASLATIALLAAACGPQPGASGAPSASAPVDQTAPSTALKVGLGYIPSVQFAPFYLAQENGYYTEAGLDVTFDNRTDADVVLLVGEGDLDIGVADGTSVIPAVSQAIPVRYLATLYGTYPSIVFAKASSGITGAAGLRGKKIGIPGKYGSSWIMLQALLDSAGMTPDDVTIELYPDYGQGVAVQQGVVNAATGFANNEPVQLELSGEPAVVLHVDDVVPLPGPGLISSVATLDAKGDAVAAFIAATLRAMTEIAAEPKIGLDAAIVAVPELEAQREKQAAILDATIATWSPATGGGAFGAIDRASWEASVVYMTKLGLVPKPVTVDELVRDDLLPAQP